MGRLTKNKKAYSGDGINWDYNNPIQMKAIIDYFLEGKLDGLGLMAARAIFLKKGNEVDEFQECRLVAAPTYIQEVIEGLIMKQLQYEINTNINQR